MENRGRILISHQLVGRGIQSLQDGELRQYKGMLSESLASHRTESGLDELLDGFLTQSPTDRPEAGHPNRNSITDASYLITPLAMGVLSYSALAGRSPVTRILVGLASGGAAYALEAYNSLMSLRGEAKGIIGKMSESDTQEALGFAERELQRRSTNSPKANNDISTSEASTHDSRGCR